VERGLRSVVAAQLENLTVTTMQAVKVRLTPRKRFETLARKLFCMGREKRTMERFVPIEIRWLNEALGRLCLTPTDMDRQCGFRPGGFSWNRSKNFPSRQARAKVEKIVGPIWSAPRVYELRRKCDALFGFDPGEMTAPQIRAELTKLGLSAPTSATLEQIEETLLRRIATMKTSAC
jgi:hypothetical protein